MMTPPAVRAIYEVNMREVPVAKIHQVIVDCVERASFALGEAERQALADARGHETSPTGRNVLDQLIENADIAQADRRPLCQGKPQSILEATRWRTVASLRGKICH